MGLTRTLGPLWHHARLSCPSRQQLGSYLLAALDPEQAAYVQFHLEIVECPFCQANLADLKDLSQSAAIAKAATSRRRLDLLSSQQLLGEDRH